MPASAVLRDWHLERSPSAGAFASGAILFSFLQAHCAMTAPIDQIVQSIGPLLIWSLPAAFFLLAVHRDRMPFLRFQPPRGPREPPLWGLREFLYLFLAWFLSQIVIATPFQIGRQVDGLVIFLVALGSGGLVVMLAFRGIKTRLGQPLSTLGWRLPFWRDLLTAVVFWVLALFPMGLLGILWQLFLYAIWGEEPAPQYLLKEFLRLATEGDRSSVALIIITGCLVAPVTEEILFRGVFFGALGERVGPFLGAILSSFVFAIVHLDLGAFLFLWILGCVLAYVYHRTGSLLVPIACHALFNGHTFAEVLLKPRQL